ncbi:subtilisin-like protein [Thozetella sp. PMI_491]|nr:subtilisin-like protein [Thozetella sp. PMI_491]
MTGVDTVHSMGIYGKGVKIAVVDSGIDWLHPALGGGIGPGYTVLSGYDYVGDGTWPDAGEREPDEDASDMIGHGTFVSGVIAGKNDWFTGVAPEATLLAYKVFSRASTTREDVIIEAFLDAYQAGVDIITASISSPSGFSEDAWAVVADRIVDAGIVVTTSAGNLGANGPFYGGSAGSGKNVLAVGSVETYISGRRSIDLTFSLNGTTSTDRMAYDGNWPYGLENLLIVDVDDGCTPLPRSMPSLANVLVLLRNGSCNGSDKAANLLPFSPQYVLFYEPAQPGNTSYTKLSYSQLPYTSLKTDKAEIIVAAIKAGASVTASVEQKWVGEPRQGGGYPSNFSSWASTYDLKLKPDIVAPGDEVTGPFWINDDFTSTSGTSFSCPYVAGVAALYISKYGGRAVHGSSFAKQLAARIVSSGESVPWKGSVSNAWASPTRVGNGLINATKVLMYDTQLSFAKFELNDTAHFQGSHNINITNSGTVPVTYFFDHQRAVSYEAYWPPNSGSGSPRIKTDSEIYTRDTGVVAPVQLPGPIEAQPGETKNAEFTFQVPAVSIFTSPYMPVYSGKILINGSNGEHLSVPYFGVASDLKTDLKNIWRTSGTAMFSTIRSIPITAKANFTFNLSLEQQDFPIFRASLTYGCKELRWDIFEQDWNGTWSYPPVVGEDGFVGSATTWAHSAEFSQFDPATQDENDLVAFPMRQLVRDAGYYWWWFGRLANGSAIAQGKYSMRVAALLPFGDPSIAADWNVWTTPTITVLG